MDRQNLFDTMVISHDVDVKHTVERMRQNASRYADILPPVPWWLVAVIHELEAGGDFTKYLGNGQPLNQVTTLVPKGRGPWKTFEEGAVDALGIQKVQEIPGFDIGHVLYFLEGFNGYGYDKWHQTPSPYLWAGTNHYKSGKYVETKGPDGQYHTKYYPDVVSKQIGVAVYLKILLSK